MNKYERARARKIAEYLSNRADKGRFGKVVELNYCSKNSRKVEVKQGMFDSMVSVNGKMEMLEIKTNSGRIDTIIDLVNKGKTLYVAYGTVPYQRSVKRFENMSLRIIQADLFLKILQDTESIRVTQAITRIAPNKKFLKRFKANSVPYIIRKDYYEEI